MASKVDICNLALTRLATARITSLSDGTVSAKDCNAIYELVAEQVMGLGPWPSCIRRVELAALASTPEYEYTYEYTLPTNPRCLRIISINESKPGEINYDIENGKLLIDESTVKIKYIAYLSDSNSYDIYLRQAIVDHLVAELIYTKTGSLSAFQAALSYATQHAQELLSQASIQTNAKDINSDVYIDARNSAWPDEGRLRD